MKTLQLTLIIILVAGLGACAADSPSTFEPASTPIATRTLLPLPTPAWTRAFLSPTPTETPPPAWVGDFVAPILTSLDGREPTYQDEFDGNLNHGWFYFVSGSRRGPFQAHIQYETLLIKLPEGKETRDSMVYNPNLIRKNFVLTFDFQFEETQPPDLARFQFDQSAAQNVAFDVFKDKTWLLSWGPSADRQSAAGTFDYFPPERIVITIIMKDGGCAVLLNDDPLAYAGDCRPGPVVRSSPWAVTFHTISNPLYPAAITIDNLKFWDVDRIPPLP